MRNFLFSSLLLTGCYQAVAQQLVVGRIILDDLTTTCTASQQSILSEAVESAHQLTDACQGFAGDDPSFEAYFGTGYGGAVFGKRFGLAASNLQKAGAVLQVGSSDTPVARLQCGNTTECPDGGQAMMRTSSGTEGVGIITVCPFAFETGNRTPNLKHISDLVAVNPSTSDLESLRSWEYVLLHEIMHLDNVGYTTPFDTSQVTTFRSAMDCPSHIGDARAVIAGAPPDPAPPGAQADGLTSIYGPTFSKLYATNNSPPNSKKPPTLALVKADTYALFAASRFFSQSFGRVVTRRDVSEDPTDQIDFDTGQDLTDPDFACNNIS